MGKVLVIEGTDGCGKATQLELLAGHLKVAGIPYKSVSYPSYSEESSALVKMYLGGEFGTNPNAVNAFAASTFYAVDRYASFKRNWEEWYNNGGIVLCDRYTTSNAIYQSSKLPESELEEYLRWLADFEYGKMGLPEPDCVIYLDMPVEYSVQLMKGRALKNLQPVDIHEQDVEYLAKCRASGRVVADFYNWKVINCIQNNQIRDRKDIHEEIWSCISVIL